MNQSAPFQKQRSQGFVLITSLLFLVIITILAVSAIGSQTLQQHMAGNLQDKTQALQAANGGLRHVENLMRMMQQPPTNAQCYQQTGGQVLQAGNCNGNGSFEIYRAVQNHFDQDGNPASQLLGDAFWQKDGIAQLEPNNGANTDYFIVFTKGLPAGTNPGDNAKQGGTYYFRITARAHDDDTNATAVTQSIYKRRL